MSSSKHTVRMLILGMGSLENKGNLAILEGTVETVKRFVPDSQFVVMSHGPRNELDRFPVRAIPSIIEAPLGSKTKKLFRTAFVLAKGLVTVFILVLWKISQSFPHLGQDTFLNSFGLKQYVDSDLVIVRGSDAAFSDFYNLDSLLFTFLMILPCLILRKKTAVLGHSVGPFKSRIAKILTRFILKRVDLITVREPLSMKILKDIGVRNRNVFETSDLAFTLPLVSDKTTNGVLQAERIPMNRPIVGVSASRLISKWFPARNQELRYQEYVQFMAKIVKHVNETLDAIVVFVPHVVGPEKYDDDRIVARDICQIISDKDMIRIINGEYSASELRGIIRHCDIFVGTRMHAVISAISACVPSLAISYLHKTEGIMNSINQGHWVCPIKGIDYDETVARIDDLYAKRSFISAELRKQTCEIEKKALHNGKLVQNLLQV